MAGPNHDQSHNHIKLTNICHCQYQIIVNKRMGKVHRSWDHNDKRTQAFLQAQKPNLSTISLFRYRTRLASLMACHFCISSSLQEKATPGASLSIFPWVFKALSFLSSISSAFRCCSAPCLISGLVLYCLGSTESVHQLGLQFWWQSPSLWNRNRVVVIRGPRKRVMTDSLLSLSKNHIVFFNVRINGFTLTAGLHYHHDFSLRSAARHQEVTILQLGQVITRVKGICTTCEHIVIFQIRQDVGRDIVWVVRVFTPKERMLFTFYESGARGGIRSGPKIRGVKLCSTAVCWATVRGCVWELYGMKG